MKIEESVSIILHKYLRGESTQEELRKAVSYFGNPGLDQKIKTVLDEFWHNVQYSIPKQYESENLSEIYNKKRPLVVHTSCYAVIVTGTEFNVKAYKDDKEIINTLESGFVIIPSTDQFRMSSGKILEPGQQFRYYREKYTVVTSN